MDLEDRKEITNLINFYGLAIDSQRWELFKQIFSSDCEADFGGGAHWYDLETFIRDFAVFHDPFDATQHTMSNHQVFVKGDQANSMTYGHWRLLRDVPGGNMWEGSGWYDDRWVRTDDGWRIRHRACRVLWWAGNNHVRETIPGMTFEDDLLTLRGEADAGNVAYLKAIAAK